MSFWILASLAGLLVFGTLAPLWRRKSWWVRIWEFPRLQYATMAGAIHAASAVLLDLAEPEGWTVAGTAGAVLIYQAFWIIPFSPFWTKQVKNATDWDDADGLCILTSNVLTPNRNAEALLRLVTESDPDVVLTLESDAWWEQQLLPLERRYPYTRKCPRSNLYGMHVYSRLPFENAVIRYLVEDDVPSIHGKLILRSGRTVRFHFLHPAPPSPTENATSLERDGELMHVGLEVARHSEPAVVCGDLNDVAWSRTTRRFRRVSRLLDPRRGRGMYNSFHARYFFLRWPLDHFFHSDHFRLRKIRRLPSIGSDHFPVLLHLQLQPEKADAQETPEPGSEEKEQARETAQRTQAWPTTRPD